MVVVKPCATAAAYEAVPERELRLDMPAVQKRLNAGGWRTLADAGVMIVVQKEATSASIFRSGKLMVKTQDAAHAERVWQEISPLYGVTLDAA